MKILYIVSRFPYPLEKGDKLRAYNQLKGLSAKNDVFLFALTDRDIKDTEMEYVKQFCKEVKVFRLNKSAIFFNLLRATFTKLPWQVGYFYSQAAQKSLDAFIARHHPHHIFCQLIRTAEYVKKYTQVHKTLDYMDVFSKGMERRLPSASSYLKPLYRAEYKRLLRYEQEVFSYFNNRIVISAQDRHLIPHTEKDKIEIIANGVDTSFFKPIARQKEYDILFNGNMNYPPNIKGAEFLVKEILPLVLKKYPGIKVLISGANPSPLVMSFSSPNVTVSGWVEDIRESFAKSKMLVAPMFMSIGLQNKSLLEAMAMQIPCITSSLANNALMAKNGESILVADTPEGFAEHIIALLSDETKAKEIGMNGYKFVIENYSWEAENRKLEDIIQHSR